MYSEGAFVPLEPSPFSGRQLPPLLGGILFLPWQERFREGVVRRFPLRHSEFSCLQLCAHTAGITEVSQGAWQLDSSHYPLPSY